MKRWAYSIVAIRVESDYEINHTVGFVEADTNEAAEEVALAVARKMYPRTEGWKEHLAVTLREDAAADTPENFRMHDS